MLNINHSVNEELSLPVVDKAYGYICEAIDTHPQFLSFLTEQVVEWGRTSVERLDASRSDPDAELLDLAVLPLPSRPLSLAEKAMVLVAIYNARFAGRDPIDPWRDNPPDTLLLARCKTLVDGQSCDPYADEPDFELTNVDLSTITSYIKDVSKAVSFGEVLEGGDEDAHSPPPTTGSIHAGGAEPAAEYRRHKKQDGTTLGPITGTMTALGYVLHRNKGLTGQSYRDHFQKSVKNGTIWVRESKSAPRKFEMFIRATSSSKADADQKKVKEYKEKVDEFVSRPKRQKSRTKASPAKSNKANQSQTKRLDLFFCRTHVFGVSDAMHRD